MGALKVGLISLGCARTLVDSEVALGSLKSEGYEIVPDVRQADIAVVNTCGFIEEAKLESIETILRLCDMKKKGKLQAVVVLGCLAQRYGAELQDQISEIDGVIGTDSYESLPRLLRPLREKKKVFEVKAKPRYILSDESPRHFLTPPHYAYVKISEGCINACSYCVIPKMKGPHRSRPMESILNEIRKITAERKISEINLIGQDTAAYGFDLDRTFQLSRLLTEVATLSAVPWVRLLYAHPGHVTDELIDVLASTPHFCRYVDFPIEHSHDDVLRRMNRGVTRAQMESRLENLRRRIPGVTVRTTVIVGFPGETDEEFEDLMEFLRQARFEKLGAFMFSSEDGARACGMSDQIPQGVREERFNAVMEQQKEISREIQEAFVGKNLRVLVDEKDSKEENLYHGRTEGDAPEVDGEVVIHSSRGLQPGEFAEVRITDTLEYDLVGTCD